MNDFYYFLTTPELEPISSPNEANYKLKIRLIDNQVLKIDPNLGYDIALISASLPSCYKNTCDLSVTVKYQDTSITVPLAESHITTDPQIKDIIVSALKSDVIIALVGNENYCEIKYQLNASIFSITMHPLAFAYTIQFSNPLNAKLGFTKDSLFENLGLIPSKYTASHRARINLLDQFFYIESNLCEPSRINDSTCNLLQIFPSDIDKINAIKFYEMKNPLYMPIASMGSLNEIYIRIRNERDVNVNWCDFIGRICFVLHFKRRSLL